MSARYDRGGCDTSMYQLLHPPTTLMSRTGVSDVLVVSFEVTSNSRMIGLAPCQSCRSAASARCTDWCVSSQVACSQYGSGTIRKMRSFETTPPPGLAVDRSFSRLIGGGATAGTTGLSTC